MNFNWCYGSWPFKEEQKHWGDNMIINRLLWDGTILVIWVFLPNKLVKEIFYILKYDTKNRPKIFSSQHLGHCLEHNSHLKNICWGFWRKWCKLNAGVVHGRSSTGCSPQTIMGRRRALYSQNTFHHVEFCYVVFKSSFHWQPPKEMGKVYYVSALLWRNIFSRMFLYLPFRRRPITLNGDL